MTTYELNMSSNPDEVSKVIDWLDDATTDKPISEEHRLQFRYALVEAINNCIEHAYDSQPGRPIRLVCETSEQSVSVTIHDQGNPYKASDNHAAHHALTDESGRGLAIINAWVSSFQISHSNGWNITRLVREIDTNHD